MAVPTNYWTRKTFSRRAALRAAAAASTGVAAISLIGCGGGSKSTSSSPSAAATDRPIDNTKGKPGGTLNLQINTFPTGLTLIDRNDNSTGKMAGLVLSALLANSFGRAEIGGTDATTREPDLAQAMPEQPDSLTYVFKLKAAKFQNGRAVTAEDVKYSYDRYATDNKSAFKQNWTWLDKVETPDGQTVRVTTKKPFADALQAMCGYDDAYVFAKEHEESAAVTEKLMGSGPFSFVSAQAPIQSSYKKNPDYYNKPYPYFDELNIYHTPDIPKEIADFNARSVNVSWWNSIDARDQIKKVRTDAQTWAYAQPAYEVVLRSDKPPLNDKRVRQALSMSIDRKKIRKAVSNGEGEDDQDLSWTNEAWGFRKPKDLGASAKFWVYDPQAAKQLLSAAGIDKPIEGDWTHGAPGVGGQVSLDATTLTQANWKTLGVANFRNNPVPATTYLTQVAVGTIETAVTTTMGLQNVAPGRQIFQRNWSPTDGVKAPTSNNSFFNNARLSQLVEKQVEQLKFEERKSSFKEIEEIIAEEQPRIPWSTGLQTWFADPFVKNIRMPQLAIRGSARYVMYWWFDKS